MARADHWDAAYTTRGVEAVSWYQALPEVSLGLVDALGIPPEAAVLDVGSGASFLVDELSARGFRDLTVLDLSASALEATRARLPADAPVRYVHADLLEWEPDRRYEVWHDRAVFHFLVAACDRERYVATLRRAVVPGGKVIVGTFAEDGPKTCSGLPVSRYTVSELSTALGRPCRPRFRPDPQIPDGLRGGSLRPDWLDREPFVFVRPAHKSKKKGDFAGIFLIMRMGHDWATKPTVRA